MINGKTQSGFEFHVSEGLGEDAIFLRALTRMNSNSLPSAERMTAVFELIEAVFNDREQEEQFYKHAASKDPTGRANVKTVYVEINEIVDILAQQDESIKKSQPSP